MLKKVNENAAPIINNEINPNNIPRCILCHQIPSIKISYDKDNINIIYKCPQLHSGTIDLLDFINKNKQKSIFLEKCGECNKSQEKDIFLFCCKCQKVLCNSCLSNHIKISNHTFIDINKYDCLCFKHSNTFSSYCLNCNQNLCIFCLNEHQKHKTIQLLNFTFSNQEKEKLKSEIKKLENLIENIEEIKNLIIQELEKIKKMNKLEIDFISQLLNTYEFEEKYNNLNYHVIQNLKDCKIKYSEKIEKFQSIYLKGKKFLSLLENKENYIKKDISLLKCSNIIKSHSGLIYQISLLKDGRLASCSSDGYLILYNVNSFQIELKMSLHKYKIFSFTQLKDGKIITCSEDNTMKIIKLIGKNQFEIIQTLSEHKKFVVKVIEFKENELISISNDQQMKFFKINEENNFYCFKSIQFQSEDNYYITIFKINENEFITASNGDHLLKFWNYNNYSLIKEIKDVYPNVINDCICLLTKVFFVYARIMIKEEFFYLKFLLMNKYIKLLI